MPHAVLFDLDDTLLATIRAKWAHNKAVAKEFFGIDLSDELMQQHWGKPFRVLLREFSAGLSFVGVATGLLSIEQLKQAGATRAVPDVTTAVTVLMDERTASHR